MIPQRFFAWKKREIHPPMSPGFSSKKARIRNPRPHQDGAGGRALTRSFPALGIHQGYRLEPWEGLPDVATFENIADFPARVLFWSPKDETTARHRNPFFVPELGIGLGSFGIDTLHTLNLGIYQRLLGKAWWTLVANDAWGVLPQMGGRKNLEELALNSVGHLKKALWAWYDVFQAENPRVTLNRLEELTVKTLGSKESCCLNTKAAETRPLLRFTAALLAEKRACLSGEEAALVPAAEALATFAEKLRLLPRRVSWAQNVPVVDLLKRYVVLADAAGVPPTPKLHLAFHLVHRIPLQGSPATAATFLDEGANGRAADMAKGLHRATFTRRFFSSWSRLASSAGKRKIE
jgi:hypothetical protein